MTGGAGDGTPKALQAKPIANASARPRRSFMAVSERGGVPVLQDVAGNNKAERNRHEHERADQAGRCGRGYVEIPATCADQETYNEPDECGSHWILARRRNMRSRALPKTRARLRIELGPATQQDVHVDAQSNWRESLLRRCAGNRRKHAPATTPAWPVPTGEPDP